MNLVGMHIAPSLLPLWRKPTIPSTTFSHHFTIKKALKKFNKFKNTFSFHLNQKTIFNSSTSSQTIKTTSNHEFISKTLNHRCPVQIKQEARLLGLLTCSCEQKRKWAVAKRLVLIFAYQANMWWSKHGHLWRWVSAFKIYLLQSSRFKLDS